MKMRTATVLLLLLFALSTKSSSADNIPVVDIWGMELVPGAKYYVLSAQSSFGGGPGLTLINGVNQTCPYDVALATFGDGIPITFSPANSTNSTGAGQVIYESTDLNVKFVPASSTVCPNSTVWQLSDYDVGTQKWFVTTGGVETNPNSWFKIVRAGGEFGVAYKFFYCPTACDSCKRLCSEVGVYENYYLGWKKRLVLAPSGVAVVFKRAEFFDYGKLKQVVGA